MFAADLLRDLGEQDLAFFTLLGVLSGDRGLTVESLLDPTPLHIAMMKTARLPVPARCNCGRVTRNIGGDRALAQC